MNVRALLSCLLFALCMSNALGAIRMVPSQYATIPLAHSAAVNGDTILIAAGTYPDQVDLSKRLTIIGAGYNLTSITGYYTFQTGSARTVSEGLRCQKSVNSGSNSQSGVCMLQGTVDSLIFRRCYFSETGTGNLYGNAFKRHTGTTGGRLYFDGCIFSAGGYSNNYNSFALWLDGESAVLTNCLIVDWNGVADPSYQSPFFGSFAGLTVNNCVFLGYRSMFYQGQGGVAAQFYNSAVYDTASTGAFIWNLPVGSTLDYCASEGAVPSGATNHLTLTSNPFVNYNRASNYQHGTSDLHPALGSDLIDAGHPDGIDILDGTRMDIGLYGGLSHFTDGGIPNYPYVESLTVPPMITTGNDLQINAVGRVGRGY